MKRSLLEKRRKGSALVAVFWIIVVLGLAVFTTVRIVYYDADVATAQIHGFEARMMAEKGIAIGVNPAVQRDDYELLSFNDSERDEGYEVTIKSEADRFNINVLLNRQDNQLLLDIFTDWGMELDESEDLISALKDWVDGDDLVGLNGAEQEYYDELGRSHHPFNRPFYSLEEMRLVRGVERLDEVKPDWRKWFTVWSGGKLDVNEASAELISSAAMVSIEEAEDLVRYVLGADLERDTEDDQRFRSVQEVMAFLSVSEINIPIVQPRLTAGSDETTRIESIGRVGNVKRKITLILRNRQGNPTILEKKEEVIP